MENSIRFFEDLGLEVVDTEDESALWQELDGKQYALVTDMDGCLPKTLTEPLYWTLYNEADEFGWTVTIKDARQLQTYIAEAATPTDLITRLAALREANIAAFESEQRG